MSSGKACDTCVCRAVCFWQRPYRERAVTGLDCGPGLPHWRGDDAEHEMEKARAEARQNDASLTNIIGGYKEALDEAEAALSRSAAVLKAARLVIEKFDACACDDVRKIYFYSPFWHAVGELRTALAERGQRWASV